MPLLSGIAAFFASRYSTKTALRSAVIQRRHEATSLLSQFRQKWIDDLRNDLAEHQSICLASKLPLNPNDVSKEKMYRLSELANRILLRVNPADPDYERLSHALAMERKSITDDDVPNPGTLSISQGVLKREWERLKSDLRNDAMGQG